MELKERNEIEERYKWDLSLVYKSESDWHKDFIRLSKMIKGLSHYKNHLLDDPGTLLNSLQYIDKAMYILEKLSSYASKLNDQDLRDTDGTKLINKSDNIQARLFEALSFVDPELLAADKRKVYSYIKEEPKLKIYKHYFDNIYRFKNHTLSVEEEKIIASASEVLSSPGKVYKVLSNADIKFGYITDENSNKIELSKGNYSKYVASQNRDVRVAAFMTLYQSFKDLKNTFAETLVGDIKANYFVSNNKNYKSPLEMSLYANNINLKVYNNLIETVNNNMDKMYKYIALRNDFLGIDELHMYDIYVSLISAYDLEYKYEDAVELVFKALHPMGEDYIKNARQIFDNRWIDVYENRGKASGAYSSFGYDIPPYILLNYDGKFHSVSTIIHELGHSMHTYYSAHNQPFVYHNYSIFVAEVASTVNEMLLNMYMQDHAQSKEEKLYFINLFLDNVRATIYRQTMFAEFEREIYKIEGSGQPLSEGLLSDTYYDLNKKYYGENNLIIDEEIKYEWMRIPHFYYQFYVYQYATGLAAAFFIADNLYKETEGFRDKYIKFLSSGSSKYPLELLKDLGIDMSSTEPIQYILNYFDIQIDKFRKTTKK